MIRNVFCLLYNFNGDFCGQLQSQPVKVYFIVIQQHKVILNLWSFYVTHKTCFHDGSVDDKFSSLKLLVSLCSEQMSHISFHVTDAL